MNRTIGVFKMHARDKWSWIWIPWIICLSSFLINVLIGYILSFQQQSEEFYTGGLFSMVVYVFVLGILTPPQTFLYALGMGVRRTDYFLGTAMMALLFSVGSSILLLLLSWMEAGTNHWGLGLHFFKLPFLSEGMVLAQGLTFMVLLLSVYFDGLLIASVYRKFGRLGSLLFFGVLLLIFLIAPLWITYLEGWDDIGRWLVDNFRSMNDVTPWLLVKTLIFALASYWLLLRATV